MKAIFFDFDGVLTRDKTGSLTTLRYLCEQTGIELRQLRIAFEKYNVTVNPPASFPTEPLSSRIATSPTDEEQSKWKQSNVAVH